MKHGKKYTEAAKQIDRQKLYEAPEALALVKKSATGIHLPLMAKRASLEIY